MALVTPGILFSNIKGSIAGTTFSNNRAGLTAKKRLVGKRLPNASQTNALNVSMATTAAWNELTFSQKSVFNSYALANTYTDRYGTVKPLTGYQWFKQLSQTSKYFTGSQLTAPPSYSIPPALPTFTVALTLDTMTITWSTAIDTSLIDIYVYSTGFVKGQARKQRGAYKLLDVRSLTLSSSFNFTAAWEAAFNLPYYPLTNGANININVLIYAVKKSSFNSGIAQTATGNYTAP